MLLQDAGAMRFIEGYKSVLLQVLDLSGKKRTKNIVNDLAAARNYAAENSGVLVQALEALKLKDCILDEEFTKAILSLKVGKWIHLRYTTRYALLLDEKIENAYAVKALTDPLHEIVGSKAFIFEAGICRYKGHYVCDGIVLSPVYIGPGYKAEFNQAYNEIKKNGRFYIKVLEET